MSNTQLQNLFPSIEICYRRIYSTHIWQRCSSTIDYILVALTVVMVAIHSQSKAIWAFQTVVNTVMRSQHHNCSARLLNKWKTCSTQILHDHLNTRLVCASRSVLTTSIIWQWNIMRPTWIPSLSRKDTIFNCYGLAYQHEVPTSGVSEHLWRFWLNTSNKNYHAGSQ